MSKCNLTTALECALTVPGIKSILLLPFGSVTDYKYTNDNPNEITDYTLSTLPIEFKGTEGVFNSSVNEKEFKNIYSHELSVFLPKMSKENRAFFNPLKNKDLTVIFNTRDGKTFIMGKEAPVRITSYSASTGGNELGNGYNFTIAGNSPYEVREIKRFTPCYSGVSGQEWRRSFFVISNASAYSWSTFEMIADITNLQFSPIVPLEPTNWTNPVIYNRDLSELNNAVSSVGTSAIEAVVYDLLSDTVLLSIISLDATYDFLAIDNSNPIRSNISIELILTTTLGGNVDPATIITITDGTNTLANGVPTDNVVGFGLGGTVSNLTINISQLYPNTNPTFNVTVTPPVGSCGSGTFTYTYEQLLDCSVSTDYQVNAGRFYSIEIDKAGPPDYRTTHLFFNGEVIVLYPTISSYHNSFTQLESDVITAVQNTSWNIDQTTVQVTELAKSWILSFYGYDNVSSIYGYRLGNDGVTTDYFYPGKTTQSNIVSWFTNSPQDATITIEDSNTTNFTTGQYQNTPTASTLTVEESDYATGNIESISIDWNDIQEIDTTNITSDSIICPNTTLNVDVTTCFNGFNKSVIGNYYLLVIQPDLSSFIIYTSSTSYSFTPILPIVNYENVDQFINWLNSVGFRVLTFVLDITTGQYFVELITTQDVTTYEAGSTGTATPVISFELTEFDITPYLHPNIQVDWNVNSVYGPRLYSGVMKDTLYDYLPNVNNVTRLKLDTNIDDLEVEDLTGFVNATLYVLDGQGGNILVQYSIPAGSFSNFNIATDVIANGYMISDIAIFQLDYDNDTQIIIPANDNASDEYAPVNTPSTLSIGRLYKFLIVGPSPSTVAVPNINSVNCNAFTPLQVSGPGAVELWLRPETLTYSWNNITQTATVVNGSNIITVTGGIFLLDTILYLSTETEVYKVIGGAGLTVELDRAVVEPSGSYAIRQAVGSTWIDSSPHNRTVTPNFTGVRPLFKSGTLNNYPAVYLAKESFYNILPLMQSPAPADLQFFAVTRSNFSDSNFILFSHSSGVTNSFLNFDLVGNNRSRTSFLTPNPSADNIQSVDGLPTPDFNISFNSFVRVVNDHVIRAGINGETPSQVAGTILNQFSSTVQRLGVRNNGVTNIDGFAGDLVEVVMYKALNDVDRQKTEGYLAWKYGIQSQLPLTHPYRFVAP